MDIADSALQHFVQLEGVLRQLRSRGLALYVHQYDTLVFGSFVVILGTAHKRVRFSWDGKESLLEVSLQELRNEYEVVPWVHDAFINLPKGERVYAEMASEAVSLLD